MPRYVRNGDHRLTLALSMTLPVSVGMSELRAYVKSSVEQWGGQRHPDDHLFYTIKDISIRRIEKEDAAPEPPKDYSYPMLWRATSGKINPETLTALRTEFDRFMADARKVFAPLEEDA